MSSTDKITLKSSDGVSFKVEKAVAMESKLIEGMIDPKDGIPLEIEHKDGIPLMQVSSNILAIVMEYCEMCVEADRASSVTHDGRNAWYAKFLRFDEATLRDILEAADFLGIHRLLDEDLPRIFKIMTPVEQEKKFSIIRKHLPHKKEEEILRGEPRPFFTDEDQGTLLLEFNLLRPC